MNDSNATGNNTGNPDTTPGPKTPPVLPPPPSRPPTSSLPVQPPAVTPDPTPNETPANDATDAPANDAPSAESQGTDTPVTDTPSAGSRQTLLKAGAVVVGLVLLGLLTWWVVTLISSGTQQAANQPPAPGTTESASAQPSRGQLPLDGVSALDYQLGDCFENFDPEATESRVVPCTSGHSAQLIAVHRYPESDSYPGIAALREKGREICQGAGLTDAVANYVLMQRNAYPSDTSWEQGDRRVDCYVTADKGNVIMESLIPSAGP